MTAEDTYKTIAEPSEGIYTEKRSKFIAIALPVRTLDEIKAHLETYQKKYYDARHVCYAYMLGAARKDFRANDNGEPSGTAGKPILGQINSNELTDILIIVTKVMMDQIKVMVMELTMMIVQHMIRGKRIIMIQITMVVTIITATILAKVIQVLDIK